jgi:tetratricopeptide (TPR) repeat protein
MSAEHPRLDDLRRRVEKDPASIAFASFAEELRRTGEATEAIRICRAGLEHHPTYLSAHVTLGRALLELEQFDEARTELEYVLHAAPDNLLALKAMGELQERTSEKPADAVMGSEPPSVQTESEPKPTPVNPVLSELEEWHARLQADQGNRSGGPGSPDRSS